MNINQIFKNLNNKTSLVLEDYNLAYQEMSEILKYKNEILRYILNNDNYHERGLLIASSDISSNIYYDLMKHDGKYPIYTTLLVLLKASMELHYSNHSEENLTIFLNNIATSTKDVKSGHFGSTMSYAIGYTIGSGIKKGIDMQKFIALYNKDLIENKEWFSQGLFNGINKQESLIEDKKFLSGLKDRYQEIKSKEWLIIFNMFKEQKNQENKSSKNTNAKTKTVKVEDSIESLIKKKNTYAQIVKNIEGIIPLKDLIENNNDKLIKYKILELEEEITFLRDFYKTHSKKLETKAKLKEKI